MGSDQSIEHVVLYSPCELEMLQPMQQRSIFGDIVGDIIGPVKGIITDALNTFKGPVQEIVHFVVSNILSGLIKFITNAIIEIFPGIPFLVQAGSNIISQFINIIPATAEALQTAIFTAIYALDNISVNIYTDVQSILGIAEKGFSSLKNISEQISYRIKSMIAETSILFTNTESSMITITGDTGSAGLIMLTQIISNTSAILTNIPATISAAIADGISDTCMIFNTVVNDILLSVQNVITACTGIVDTIITTVESQLKMASSILKLTVKTATSDIQALIQEASKEAKLVPIEGARALGIAVNVARTTLDETNQILTTVSTDTEKAIRFTTATAKNGITLIDSVVSKLEHMSKIFTFSIILSVILIAFLIFKDMKKISRGYRI